MRTTTINQWLSTRYGVTWLLRCIPCRVLAPFPLFAWDAIATVASLLPSPPLTTDQVELMRADNVVAAEGVGTFADLSITPGGVDELLDR